MNGYIAFFKKEWLEAIRTKRLLIIIVAFAILGILGPFTTLLTPTMMEMAMPEGVTFEMPDPNAINAWASFFKNISQMGTIIVLLMFAGMLANDVQKQSLIPLITKGLSRSSIIWAKLSINYLLWTISYFVCFIISYSYTLYYWDQSIVQHLFLAIFGAWLCGIFLITLLMFFTALFLTFTGALLGTAIVIVTLLTLPILSATDPFNPLMLFSHATALLLGDNVSDAYWQLATTMVIIGFLQLASIQLFNKKIL